MQLWELFVLAVGLSMDAFAVSVCKGLSVGRVRPAHALTCGAWFGGFQALMPLTGWLLGVRLQELIVSIDHWIAFILLCIIGVNMIRGSREEGEEDMEASFSAKAMAPLAVATSIDALAVGVTFAFLQVNVFISCGIIGAVTFIISAAGVKIGNVFGTKYKQKAEIAGGIALILIGTKILLEHLGILG